ARIGSRQEPVALFARRRGAQAWIPRMARARLPAAFRRAGRDATAHSQSGGCLPRNATRGVGANLDITGRIRPASQTRGLAGPRPRTVLATPTERGGVG